MAKSSRASIRKENKRKLRINIFGPNEMARTERLSGKLLELASKPKPRDNTRTMEVEIGSTESKKIQYDERHVKQPEEMEIDTGAFKVSSQSKSFRHTRIGKRVSHRKSAIVFPKYQSKKVSRRKGNDIK